MLKYLVVGLGGFIGANVRYAVGVWVQGRWGSTFPYGTLLINLTGSFILGLFATLALRYAWNDYLRLLVAVGFVGAYTTFSTFEYETVQLVSAGSLSRAFANISLSVVFGFGAAFLGVVTARLIMRSAF